MPKGTKVEKIYNALVKKGANVGKAARIAQAETGLSLATGSPPKNPSKGTAQQVRSSKKAVAPVRQPETMKQFIARRNKTGKKKGVA